MINAWLQVRSRHRVHMTSAGHVTHVALNASTCRLRISRNLRLLFQNETSVQSWYVFFSYDCFKQNSGCFMGSLTNFKKIVRFGDTRNRSTNVENGNGIESAKTTKNRQTGKFWGLNVFTMGSKQVRILFYSFFVCYAFTHVFGEPRFFAIFGSIIY